MLGLSMSDGIVPNWAGILKGWSDYCHIKWCSCCAGMPALLSCFRKYSHLLALDTAVLMWVNSIIMYTVIDWICALKIMVLPKDSSASITTFVPSHRSGPDGHFYSFFVRHLTTKLTTILPQLFFNHRLMPSPSLNTPLESLTYVW